MQLSPDITHDFVDYVDYLDPVTLRLRDGTTYIVTHALRNQVDTTEHTPSGGEVKQGDTVWQFPVAESSPTTNSLLGATLEEEDGTTWTILSAALQVRSSKWECRARNLIVESGLDTTLTIAQCTYYPHSSSGQPVETWETLYDNILGKVQLETVEATKAHGADDSTSSYRITLAVALPILLGSNYIVFDSSGKAFRLLSYQNPDKIDQLPYIVARRAVRYET